MTQIILRVITAMVSLLLTTCTALANTPVSEILCYVDPEMRTTTDFICNNGRCPEINEPACPRTDKNQTVYLKYFHKENSQLLDAGEYPCIGQTGLDVCLAFQGVALMQVPKTKKNESFLRSIFSVN